MQTRFQVVLAFVLGGLAGWIVKEAVSHPPEKSQLAFVEDRLANAYDFADMPREDVTLALTLSLHCLADNPEDAACYSSAIRWYKVLGADGEAESLHKKAPQSVKRSKEWKSVSIWFR